MVLSTHIYSLTLFLSHSLASSLSVLLNLSLSLSFYPSYIFISVPDPFTLVSPTRLMSAHSRWDWVKTSARGDSSGSMCGLIMRRQRICTVVVGCPRRRRDPENGLPRISIYYIIQSRRKKLNRSGDDSVRRLNFDNKNNATG